MTTTAWELPHLRRSPYALNQERARYITKKLVEKLEAVLLGVQAALIAITATIDKVTLEWQLALYALSALFAAFGVLAWHFGGPFQRGGAWLVLWLGSAILMPLVMANLVLPGEYGASPACTQLCAYPSAPLVIFAFYPWHKIEQSWMRASYELLFLAVVILEPLAIILWIQPYLTLTNCISVAVTALLNIAFYVVGKALGRVCTTAARDQIGAVSAEYERQLNFMHSVAGQKLSAAIEHYAQNRQERVIADLEQLGDVLMMQRISLSASQEFVSVTELAALYKEYLETDDRPIELVFQLSASNVKIPQPVGRLFDRALGDLLKNAVQHGEPPVRVRIAVKNDELQLTVFDHGSGLSEDQVLRSRRLSQLHAEARQLEGDLRPVHDEDGGAGVRLRVPISA